MTDTPFDPAAVDPETAAFVAEFEAKLADLPAAHEVPPEVSRKARDEGYGIFPFYPAEAAATDHKIPGAPGGPGRVRIMRPEGKPKGVFLHIHGGGWTLGRPWHQDHRMKGLVATTGCATVSVEYRLAPENPWPACIDDCTAAANWLCDVIEDEFGTSRIVIGGESAGAHLSAATLLAMKSAGRLTQFAGAWFCYGAFDLSGTPSVVNWGSRKLVLSTPTIRWFTANLGLPVERMRDPLVSPLYGDLTGMPAALFQCGTYDPLADDTAFMAHRWAMAGAAAETTWYPGGIHAFDYFDSAQGRAAIGEGAAFLSRCFAS